MKSSPDRRFAAARPWEQKKGAAACLLADKYATGNREGRRREIKRVFGRLRMREPAGEGTATESGENAPEEKSGR